jgi:hypothetical protein
VTLHEAVKLVRDAGYSVDSDFDTQTVKVEGYAPMSVEAFIGWARGIRGADVYS